MVGYSKDGRYYLFGGQTYPYAANWRGMAVPANGRGSRELGDVAPRTNLNVVIDKRTPTVTPDTSMDMSTVSSGSDNTLLYVGGAILAAGAFYFLYWRKRKGA